MALRLGLGPPHAGLYTCSLLSTHTSTAPPLGFVCGDGHGGQMGVGMGVGSLLASCAPQRWNSSHRAWWQIPLLVIPISCFERNIKWREIPCAAWISALRRGETESGRTDVFYPRSLDLSCGLAGIPSRPVPRVDRNSWRPQ